MGVFIHSGAVNMQGGLEARSGHWWNQAVADQISTTQKTNSAVENHIELTKLGIELFISAGFTAAKHWR